MALDEVDRRLLAYLQKDALVDRNEVAKALYISPRSVRERIRKLRESGVISFTIWIDRAKAGFPATADILVEVESRRVEQIAEELAQFPEVAYVAITTGRLDVGIQVRSPSMDALHRFLMEKVVPIPGVIRVHTEMVYRLIKTTWTPYASTNDAASR